MKYRLVPEPYFRALVRLAWLQERYDEVMSEDGPITAEWEREHGRLMDAISDEVDEIRMLRREIARELRENWGGG